MKKLLLTLLALPLIASAQQPPVLRNPFTTNPPLESLQLGTNIAKTAPINPANILPGVGVFDLDGSATLAGRATTADSISSVTEGTAVATDGNGNFIHFYSVDGRVMMRFDRTTGSLRVTNSVVASSFTGTLLSQSVTPGYIAATAINYDQPSRMTNIWLSLSSNGVDFVRMQGNTPIYTNLAAGTRDPSYMRWTNGVHYIVHSGGTLSNIYIIKSLNLTNWSAFKTIPITTPGGLNIPHWLFDATGPHIMFNYDTGKAYGELHLPWNDSTWATNVVTPTIVTTTNGVLTDGNTFFVATPSGRYVALGPLGSRTSSSLTNGWTSLSASLQPITDDFPDGGDTVGAYYIGNILRWHFTAGNNFFTPPNDVVLKHYDSGDDGLTWSAAVVESYDNPVFNWNQPTLSPIGVTNTVLVVSNGVALGPLSRQNFLGADVVNASKVTATNITAESFTGPIRPESISGDLNVNSVTTAGITSAVVKADALIAPIDGANVTGQVPSAFSADTSEASYSANVILDPSHPSIEAVTLDDDGFYFKNVAGDIITTIDRVTGGLYVGGSVGVTANIWVTTNVLGNGVLLQFKGGILTGVVP